MNYLKKLTPFNFFYFVSGGNQRRGLQLHSQVLDSDNRFLVNITTNIFFSLDYQYNNLKFLSTCSTFLSARKGR